MQPTKLTMTFGVIVFVSTLVAWLYGSQSGVDTQILWAVSTPIVLALFVGQQLAHASEQAQKAADQTNGTLTTRIESVVARVVRETLAARDSARTRAINGDAGGPTPDLTELIHATETENE